MTLFPATALDLKQSVAEAWRMTRGSGLRVWIGAYFAVLPFLILLRLLDGVWDVAPDVAAAAVARFVAVIVFFLELAIVGAYASSVFRQAGVLGAGGPAPSV